jgi:hypothetical protein
MLEEKEKTIVEINGVKLEIDMRYAKVLDQYKIGDSVKVLIKEYQNQFVAYPGVIVGFNNFKELPTIVVAYIKVDYSNVEMRFIYLNKETKETEICPIVDEEIPFDVGHIIDLFDRKIAVKENEIADIQAHKQYFMDQFGKYFKDFIK